jgi:hypothetical protein
MTVSMGLEHDVWCVATSVSLVNTGGLWVVRFICVLIQVLQTSMALMEVHTSTFVCALSSN